jgi:CDP-paratose 2-epimerase
MKKILITGGAGFIGTNLAYELMKTKNNYVVVLDNLSRKGVKNNLAWLMSLKRANFKFINADIRDYKKLKEMVKDAKEIYHLAAQVAVTTSVEKPVEDFDINTGGTLYLLEAARLKAPKAVFVFSSTNKVYGELDDLKLKEGRRKYLPAGKLKEGIDEERTADFHSPYGCSKGAADQYVRDYFRIYGLKTVVFRQSCIYGTHQYGNEDQGWVANFVIRAFLNRRINIYGDGKQVRDVLEVNDLIKAYKLAVKKSVVTAGQIYNIGGGKENTFSLIELINMLNKELTKDIELKYYPWRPGDQRFFVSNNNKFINQTRWKISISKKQGIRRLIKWTSENIDLIKKVNL